MKKAEESKKGNVMLNAGELFHKKGEHDHDSRKVSGLSV